MMGGGNDLIVLRRSQDSLEDSNLVNKVNSSRRKGMESTRRISNYKPIMSPTTSVAASVLHAFVLVILIFQHGLCDAVGEKDSTAPSLNEIPDQVAMAAEHRIGVHHGSGPSGPGPTGSYHPPPPGYNGPKQPHHPPADDAWPLQSHHDMPQIKILQVQCEKSYMRVNIEFDRPFYGMIFSKGHYSDTHCVHLPPGSGHLSATFDIYLNSCGMTSSANNNGVYGPAPSGTFIENIIIIQYDPLVQEVWDQARKLRCTWYDFYEKSVTFRPFQVDMLHAVTANFLGDNLQCWMQIQVGKGPWASEVSGIVKIGQTMTMVLAIKDDENKFDMLVRNCVAHDGKRAPIQLVDQYGCVTRPKIMSRFHKIKNFGASASVVSYAYFQAFKFPDSMNVHFQCVIQVCRYQCPEPKCGGDEIYGPPGHGDPRIPHGPHAAYSENQETVASSPSGGTSQDQEPAHSEPQPQKVPPPVPENHKQRLPPALPPPNYQKPMLPPPPNRIRGRQPSAHMLPPRPLHPNNGGYANVKREGVIDDHDDSEEMPHTYAALEGRPRSVDFDQRHEPFVRDKRSADEPIADQHFVVKFTHVQKRSAEPSTDVETTRVIQVVAPGDVAFSLGDPSNNATAESVVIESTAHEIDGICMSVSSFVGGLVMLLLLLVVATLVAAFLFVRVRSIHRKTAVFTGGFDNPEYLKHQSVTN